MLLLQGCGNGQITGKLDFSERMIKFHCGNIYRKVAVQNRLELFVKLKRRGKTLVGVQAVKDLNPVS